MSQIIQELKMKLNQAQTEFHTENQRGALKDSAKIAELEAVMSDLSQQLDVEQRLAENKQVHEQRVEESHTEIAYIMDTLQVEGNHMRDLAANEAAYQLIREVVQLTLMERDEKYLKEISKLNEQIATVTAEKDTLQGKYNDIETELNMTKGELIDSNQKRDAAAKQLEEANNEVARLNSHIDDIRIENSLGASAATRVTNLNSNLADLVKNYEQTKPAIYDIEPIDLRGSKFKAKLAETDEEITFGYLEKGKYREVTAEEAEVFRADYETKRATEDTTLDTREKVSVDTPVLQFQDPVDGMVEGDVNGEVAAKTVEERLQALELAVFGKVEVAA